MKYFGGFIELEIPATDSSGAWHTEALCLQNGRSCLHFILQQIKPAKIFLPAWCCDALVEPLLLNKIPYEFYLLGKDLLPEKEIRLQENEYIIAINYAGIFSHHADVLYALYGNRLILDNTQAFFEKGFRDCFSFNSARKFFGLADGAYLYSPEDFSGKTKQLPRNIPVAPEHLILRRQGEQERAYEYYQRYEESMSCELKLVSTDSEKLLNSIDYAAAAKRRQENFEVYHRVLGEGNLLDLPAAGESVPHFYPYLPAVVTDRRKLAAEGIFIPVFWKEALQRVPENSFEAQLVSRLLPVPLDHRYQAEECREVAERLREVTC